MGDDNALYNSYLTVRYKQIEIQILIVFNCWILVNKEDVSRLFLDNVI